jgi:hypothetical protein
MIRNSTITTSMFWARWRTTAAGVPRVIPFRRRP